MYETVCPGRIELRLAAEYMLDAGFRLQMADGLLTYEDRQVLVETSYLSPPPDYLNLLYELSLEGYTPVLAHPERYMYMTKEDLFPAEGQGLQVPAELVSHFAGVYGARPAKYAAYLMKEGFYELCRFRPASSRRLQEKPCPAELSAKCSTVSERC